MGRATESRPAGGPYRAPAVCSSSSSRTLAPGQSRSCFGFPSGSRPPRLGAEAINAWLARQLSARDLRFDRETVRHQQEPGCRPGLDRQRDRLAALSRRAGLARLRRVHRGRRARSCGTTLSTSTRSMDFTSRDRYRHVARAYREALKHRGDRARREPRRPVAGGPVRGPGGRRSRPRGLVAARRGPQRGRA